MFACFLLANVVGVLVLMGPAGLGLFVNSILDTTTTEALVAIPLYVLLGELLFRTGGITTLYAVAQPPDRRDPRPALCHRHDAGGLPRRDFRLRDGVGRHARPLRLSDHDRARLRPPAVDRHDPRRRHARSDHPAERAGDHPGHARQHLDRELSRRRDHCRACFSQACLRSTRSRGRCSIPPSTRRVDPRPPSERGWWPVLQSILQILPLCFIIFLVLGLIILGVAQPTEAAAAGIIGIVLIAVFTRSISWQVIYQACYGAAVTTADDPDHSRQRQAVQPVAGLSPARPPGLIGLVSDLEVNRWIVFFIMMATVFVFCMFMDQLALMLIAVPVYSPLIAHLGFDPIWFWMLFLINITLGGITPPFGYTMFVFKSVAPDVPLMEVYRAAWPMVWIAVLGMVLMTVFPQIVTWLPAAGR